MDGFQKQGATCLSQPQQASSPISRIGCHLDQATPLQRFQCGGQGRAIHRE
jgi:hypothetical protein